MSASTASFTLTKLIPKPPSLSSSSSPSSSFLRFTQTRTRFHSLKLSTRASATISVGDKLPEATLSHIPPSSDDPQTITISSLTANKKAILFAVPGAFTPTCSQKHLPGFLNHAAELRAKGVDTIACISVNDAFVMKAWGEAQKIGEEILMLSDGNLEFTNKIGCQLDLSDKPVGLGVRSRRYAMLVENGVVKVLNLEDGGAFNNSSAEDMLKAL